MNGRSISFLIASAIISVIISNISAQGINEPCNVATKRCIGLNLLCEQDLCVCAPGHQYFNTSVCLREVSKLNENCTENIQCFAPLGEHAVCMNQTCKCEDGYSPAANLTRCLSVSRVGDRCVDVSECQLGVKQNHQSRVACVGNVCVCNATYTASHDRTECNGAAVITVTSIFLLMFATLTSLL